jgi:hypothetical protein
MSFLEIFPSDIRNLLTPFCDESAAFESHCSNGLVFVNGENILPSNIQLRYLRRKHTFPFISNDNGKKFVRLVKLLLCLIAETKGQSKKELLCCFLFNQVLTKAPRQFFASNTKLLNVVEDKIAYFMKDPTTTALFRHYCVKWRDYFAQCYVYI